MKSRFQLRLSNQSKQVGDEHCLIQAISFVHPLHLAFPDLPQLS
ncbi:MAG: hypothetical protein ACJ8BW_23020 [Ktedonobacteraceae bacterium]